MLQDKRNSMIRYTKATDQSVEIEQVTNQPLLYLDQWMWSLLSRDSDLRYRFIDLAVNVKATIMYSGITLIELSQINVSDQMEAIAEVMDGVDYGFSDANPSSVIEKEEKFGDPERSEFHGANPAAGSQLIENFFFNVSNPLDPFRISDIIRITDNQVRDQFKRVGEVFNGLNPVILKARTDANALDRAKKRHGLKEVKGNSYPFTRDIYRFAIDFVVANENMNMPSKEWRDLLNTVVPVAYFDLVLLDNRWCHFIRTNCPLYYPDIAKVFSKNELNDFFSELEDFQNL